MLKKYEMEKESRNFGMWYYTYMQMQLENSCPFFIACYKQVLNYVQVLRSFALCTSSSEFWIMYKFFDKASSLKSFII